jgi:diaminohydroxyphosphoribosylaminopyrimidine deaminase/5-amino-6-(5-phosphoribosylamino)uracil reductase
MTMPEIAEDFDVQMMRRALRLAMNGRGTVEPNPFVGCVLVKDGRVIGEGYTQPFGGLHAEPTALASVTESPEGATAYVTLEPCCHTNKKTPPCVPALINAKIARVVVGCLDPNPEVNGKGLEQLRAAGIAVTSDMLGDHARQLLAPFIARTTFRRPYITLKWAETADGKVAGPGGQRVAITNAKSNQLVHDLRSHCDSILVGVNTVLTDDPLLTARKASRPRHPARFVLDTHLRTPVDARVVQNRDASTDILCGHQTEGPFRHRRDALIENGLNVTIVPQVSEGRLSLPKVIERIHDAFRYDLLVEPGPTLAKSFLDAGLVDRVWIIQSSKRVDDPTAPAAAGVPNEYVQTGQLNIDGDVLIEYLNPASDVFFSADRSADLVLAEDAWSSR